MENSEFILLFLILLVMAIRWLFMPKIKGFLGELKVSSWLRSLNSKEYKVLNDVLIKSGGRSSQIDHVIVSIYGIFVIETKHYKGWIHGHEKSEYWTQSIYRYKNRFRNPIIQNKGHIRTLRQLLRDYQGLTYHSIIVFSGQATLKNVYTDVPVIYPRQLLRTIKKQKAQKILTMEEVKEIAGRIKAASISGSAARRKHVRKARNNARNQRRKESDSVCPRCGGKLLLKKGRYGKFYGCSNFPRCRYSKKR